MINTEEKGIESSTQTKRKMVLVVDDDPQVTGVILEMLAAAGYEAEAAPGAIAAIGMLANFTPDVVLTDLVMPEGEGMELILHLNRRENRPPIIAMSGNATGKLFLRASELLGVRVTLKKPFSQEELDKALMTAIV